MVLLTFLTLRTFRKKSGLGKGDGGWGAYETMKTKNQSTLNCTVLARLTHAPIKKTNTKRVRKRANQSCGSLSPKMSHNKQDRSHSHVAGYQTRWPICPSYQRNCFSYHLEKKKKMHKALLRVSQDRDAGLSPTANGATSNKAPPRGGDGGGPPQSSISLTFRTRFHSPVV